MDGSSAAGTFLSSISARMPTQTQASSLKDLKQLQRWRNAADWQTCCNGFASSTNFWLNRTLGRLFFKLFPGQVEKDERQCKRCWYNLSTLQFPSKSGIASFSLWLFYMPNRQVMQIQVFFSNCSVYYSRSSRGNVFGVPWSLALLPIPPHRRAAVLLGSNPTHDYSPSISRISLINGMDPLTIQRLNDVTFQNLETGQH